MRKTIIKVTYTAERKQPYIPIDVEAYTRRGESPVIAEKDLIDINDTMQISKPKKNSTYSYQVMLAFKENHKLFNLNLLFKDADLSSKMDHTAYWSYVHSMVNVVFNELSRSLNILKAKIK